MGQSRKKDQLSFAGILKLLYTNRKSGILKVKSVEGELLIHFLEGKIVGVDTARGQDWIIGQYLIEGEVLTERRLLRALRIATQKSITPEEVLVKKRYISPDVLKRYMDLYSREVILPLFGKVGLVCSFLSEDPVENQWLPPVSVPYLLKEGERRSREWPLLAKRIPSEGVVYAKDKSFISQVMKDGDEEGNSLFSDRMDPELGANERIVYYFVDGRRPVKLLARAAGLDLFSTYKALYNLENKFMVKVVSSQGSEVRRESTVIPYIVRGLFYLLILAALAGLGLNRPGPLKILAGERGVDIQQIMDAAKEAELLELDSAVRAVYLEKTTCPTSLEAAAELSGLSGVDVSRFDFRCEAAKGYRLDWKSER